MTFKSLTFPVTLILTPVCAAQTTCLGANCSPVDTVDQMYTTNLTLGHLLADMEYQSELERGILTSEREQCYGACRMEFEENMNSCRVVYGGTGSLLPGWVPNEYGTVDHQSMQQCFDEARARQGRCLSPVYSCNEQ